MDEKLATLAWQAKHAAWKIDPECEKAPRAAGRRHRQAEAREEEEEEEEVVSESDGVDNDEKDEDYDVDDEEGEKGSANRQVRVTCVAPSGEQISRPPPDRIPASTPPSRRPTRQGAAKWSDMS